MILDDEIFYYLPKEKHIFYVLILKRKVNKFLLNVSIMYISVIKNI